MQGDNPQGTQTLGGGVGVVLGDPSPLGRGWAVDWEGGTGTVTARRQVLTLG